MLTGSAWGVVKEHDAKHKGFVPKGFNAKSPRAVDKLNTDIPNGLSFLEQSPAKYVVHIRSIQHTCVPCCRSPRGHCRSPCHSLPVAGCLLECEHRPGRAGGFRDCVRFARARTHARTAGPCMGHGNVTVERAWNPTVGRISRPRLASVERASETRAFAHPARGHVLHGCPGCL